jgi:gamma-glutamylcyclotransferase (GGCT)/AIG2-like uncharacterized protein YtfP
MPAVRMSQKVAVGTVYVAANAIWDKIEELENSDVVEPHWEETKTEITEGQYFKTLDVDAQREYLS